MTIFCSCCMQHKQAKHFSKWINNGKKTARRCNDCQKHENKLMAQRKQQAELKAKQVRTGCDKLSSGLSRTVYGKSKCDVRDRIADIKAQQQIENDYEI